MRTSLNVIFTFFLALMITSQAFAKTKPTETDRSAEQFLKRFHQNPQLAQNELPPDIRSGVVVPRGLLTTQFLNRKLITEKAQLRARLIERSLPSSRFFSLIQVKDQASDLVENGIVNSNILDLDQKGLSQSQVDYVMWSDDYWPTQRGMLGKRYADPNYPDSDNWKTNYQYIHDHPVSELLKSKNPVDLDNLSPAEKYDLLVGDPLMSLTRYSWKVGQDLLAKDGEVPDWIGICHGWSGATHMKQPIPADSVVLKAADGTPLTFFQSDVKALTSMLWAHSYPPVRFIGSKCKDAEPIKDDKGRLTAPECNDTNPGTFFLTLTNQLGINHRSFVMDATTEDEIWNFSIISYKSTYFNPQSLLTTDNLAEALIPIEKYSLDKFQSTRDPGSKFVVGVIMDVTYMHEASPSHEIQTTPETRTSRYIYDLELDSQKNVIGGEWYVRSHPDFLWTFPVDAKSQTAADFYLKPSDWDPTPGQGQQPVPTSWLAGAQEAANRGAPLLSVVQRIVDVAPKAAPLAPLATTSTPTP